MAKTIDRLTVEAEALIPVMRDKWITIGLATGPADREAAQAAISDAYRMAGLEPPRIWIWLGSPWAGNIASCILDTVGDPARIWNPVNDPVGNRIWGQLTGELQSKIYDQLLDPVRFQIGQEVGNTIEAQIQAQVGHGVDALVQAQIRDQVLAQDLDQDPSQVWHQIREMIVQEGAHGLRGCWNRRSEARCGLHDASWLVSYDFFHCARLIDGTECREPLMRLARVAGWWWPFKGACIITERQRHFIVTGYTGCTAPTVRQSVIPTAGQSMPGTVRVFLHRSSKTDSGSRRPPSRPKATPIYAG